YEALVVDSDSNSASRGRGPSIATQLLHRNGASDALNRVGAYFDEGRRPHSPAERPPSYPPPMTTTAPYPAAATAPEARVHGEAIVYRLYDVGYGIQLDQAAELLASSAPERTRPVRGEAQAIQIPNPPVSVGLGTEQVVIGGETREVELSARLFDFGVVSLRARLCSPEPQPWSAFASYGAELGSNPCWGDVFGGVRDRLIGRIERAIERAGRSPVTEDYVVFRVNRLEDAEGARLAPDVLRDEDIARLLLGEPRPLSGAARKELLSPRFSYYEDDLTVLTWGSALVVEPVAEDTGVQYVLEFANAQLLELRYYDAV